MDVPGYRPRIPDRAVEECLQAAGAVGLEGPKGCGKTWTAREHCRSQILIGDAAGNFHNRQLAQMAPSLALSGETPRLLDEWQEAPAILDAVRSEMDGGEKRQFILTASSAPHRREGMKSAAGRIATLRIRTLTLFETGDSDGCVSLAELFHDGLEPRMTEAVTLQDLASFIVRGGWPGSLQLSLPQAKLLPGRVIDAILEEGAVRLDGVRRNKTKMRLLLRALARCESTTASSRALRRDILTADGTDISNPTILVYLDVLRRLFVLDDQPPFAPSVRSSVRMKQTAKRHLADPSLACALLNMNETGLIENLSLMQRLFEALCEHDLRVYAESFGGQLFHYEDYRGEKIDAVVEDPNGDWGAFDIRLGASQIEEAASDLLAVQKGIAGEHDGRVPKFLCVLCGLTNAAYRRPDGVMVVPITSLRP